MAAGLVERGCRVTIFCAAHAGRAADETVDGVRFVRRGSKLTSTSAGMLALADAGGFGGSTSSSTSRTGCRSSPGW